MQDKLSGFFIKCFSKLLLVLSTVCLFSKIASAQDYPPAAYVTVDSSAYIGGNLSVADNTAQKAFDTINGLPLGNVFSVFGRTGVVVSQSGDYVCNQVTGSVCDTGNQNIADLKTFSTLPQSNAVPTVGDDLTNKTYVDAFVQGLTPKAAVAACTVVAGTLASDFENGDTVDTYVLQTGDRLLIKNQASAVENGIYTVNASGAPTRATDSDTSAEVEAGTFTYCINGDTYPAGNINTQWVQYEVSPTINVDPLNYRLLSTVPVYTASNGLNLNVTDFRLGGTLTQATTIGFGTNDLILDLTSTGEFHVQDAGTDAFIVDANGNAGVGTSAPLTTFDVTKTTNVAGLEFIPIADYQHVAVTPPGPGDTKILQIDYLMTNDAGIQFLAAEDYIAQVVPTAGAEGAIRVWTLADTSGVTDFAMQLSDFAGAASLTIGTTGEGNVILHEASGGNNVTLAPASPGVSAYTFRFPSDGGANGYVLQTDGTGVTSWTSVAGTLITASNGLTLNTNDVQLGGTLVQPTSIDIDTFDLSIDMSSSGNFIVNDGATPALFVDSSNGYVGMGTNAPASNLHIVRQTADPDTEVTLATLENVDADPLATSTSDIDYVFTNDFGSQVTMAKVRASSTVIAAGSETGMIKLSTLDGNGTMVDGFSTYNIDSFLGVDTSVAVIGTSTYRGLLTLEDGSGDEIRILSPTAIGTSWNLVLPADDGLNGQVLTTDGAGTTSWTTVSGGAGITSLNGETGAAQTLAVGTAGTDFAIATTTDTNTFNLPTASATNRGALSTTDWSTFNSKQPGDATLTALAAYNTNGLITQIAPDTFTGRTIVTSGAGIGVVDGNGVAGNPTIGVADDLAAIEALSGTGYAARIGSNSWATRTLTAANADDIGITNIAGVAGGSVFSFARTASPGTDPGLGANQATFGSIGVLFEGLADTFETSLTVSGPTADRTITLPDATGTVAVSATAPVTLSAAGAIGMPQATSVVDGYLDNLDWVTFNSKQAGDATLTALAAFNTNGFMVQTAADTFAGRTLTVQDALDMFITNPAGTAGNPILGFSRTATLGSTLSANQTTFASTGVIFEGSTANTFQTLLQPVNPTADRTINVPDATGTIAVVGSAPLSIASSGTISITQAGAGTNGYLSSTDWNTFNNKIGGSGTTNYLPKFTAAGTIGISKLYQDPTTGKIGLNTTSPVSFLDISNDATSPSDLDVYLQCVQGGGAPQFCSGNFLTRNAARTTTQAGDNLLILGAYGSIGGSVAGGTSASLPVAEITMIADQNYTGTSPYAAGNNRATSMFFSTSGASAGLITQAAITYEGKLKVGIDDTQTVPNERLYVENNAATVATIDRWGNDGKLIQFQRDGANVGDIAVAAGVVSYNTFTGSHLGWAPESAKYQMGQVMEMTGDNKRMSVGVGEPVMGVKASTKKNSPAILGAYFMKREENMGINNLSLVMAVGNGIMWVKNDGTELNPGDKLISSDVEGCAMKDDRKDAESYIIARVSEKVNYSTKDKVLGGKCVPVDVLFEPSIRANK